jgi:hypothetical protein
MSSTSTAPEEVPVERVRRMRTVRRIFVGLLALFLLLGLLGVFGVKTATTSASGGGYDLQVTYAKLARPGLAVPWTVEIRHAGGFHGKTVEVSTTDGYFDLMDENGLDPDPSSATTSGDNIVWEFDAPKGDTLTISFDGRIGPSVQSLWPPEAETAVLEKGKPVVSVKYRTRVWP